MDKQLIKMIKINNFQYNSNRDPQVYRRSVNEAFRIQALFAGDGTVCCTLRDAEHQVISEKAIAAPGTFTHELTFTTPGVRIITLSAEGAGQKFSQDLRLDVMEHAWLG
ncbi:MAG: hypothetical protein Q8K21_10825 [Hydrogenophaga sp.]|uniref:hypothetical protein n=1 Tax=Hydrogenophaga sp. TaxID=1904254 RepID=UPI0027319E55|nr:hypothetical protein [Hydrogenophaga sp.]MDP2164690.1 hypothetical protein [Hydrogenophaga sp.]